MKCPVCNVDLVMSERAGVEIDYCPECRGVWLDRGELDKIIEKSSSSAPAASESNRGYERPVERSSHDSHDDHDNRGNQGYGQRKKKESWLGDMFDF